MRVLTIGSMFPPHHHGGYELIWHSSVEHLAARGHDVEVLASDFALDDPAGPPEPPVPVRRELRWYWRDHGFPRVSARERLAVERHNAGVVREALERHRPDVVGWWAMGAMSLSLIEQVRRAGVPSVAIACDDWFVYGPEVDAWTRAFARRPRLARLVERATGIPTRPDPAVIEGWVFLSEELRRRTARAGFEPRAARVVHRGVDPGVFREAPPEPWAWRLAYVGRLDERKGVDLAVSALAELPPEATLAVIGRGDDAYAAELRELAERLGTAARVRFGHGAPAEVAEAIAAADALVFPVRWAEPWGLVPLEGMAVGRPVVASGRGGSAEYLRDGENCLIADPDAGPGALAAAVRRLAADAELRERLRAGGLATAHALDPRRFDEAVEDALAAAARRD